MGKEERENEGYPRLTAYCIAEGFRSKALAAFLKREHGVNPRVFDEAIYAVSQITISDCLTQYMFQAYHLPLLPGYAPNVNVRSSAPSKSSSARKMLFKMSQAEEYGYDGSYFPPSSPVNVGFIHQDGYISSSPQNRYRDTTESDTDAEQWATSTGPESSPPPTPHVSAKVASKPGRIKDDTVQNLEQSVGEVVIFDYGVAVFLGFNERQEREMLEDVQRVRTGTVEYDWITAYQSSLQGGIVYSVATGE